MVKKLSLFLLSIMLVLTMMPVTSFVKEANAINTSMYTVRYDANGGSGSMSDSKFLVDVSYPLKRNKFTRDGYKFRNWSTGKAGNGKVCSDGATVRNLADANQTVTLYAQWDATTASKDVTVTYNANGGSGTMKPQSMKRDTSTLLTKNSFIRSGYQFIGWSKNKNDTSAQYGDGVSVSFSDSVTLYAVWSKVPSYMATVTYDSNGAGQSSYTQVVPTSVYSSLTDVKFSRNGYTFAGWSLTKDGAVKYKNKEMVAFTKDTTLYAVWNKIVPKVYTVTFNANGGKGTMTKQPLTDGKGKLNANKFTRTGYTFKGWTTTAKGKVLYKNQANVNITKNTTLYAVWEGKPVKVRYHANGGQNGLDVPIVTYRVGDKVTVKSGNKLSRDYYDFTGWSTSKTGKVNRKVGSTFVITEDKDIILYAVWKRSSLSDCAKIVYTKIGSEHMWHQYAVTKREIPEAVAWAKKYNISTSATNVGELRGKDYWIMCNRAVSIALQQAGYMNKDAIINHDSLSSAKVYAQKYGGTVSGTYYKGKMNKDCKVYHPNKLFANLSSGYKPKTGAIYVYDSNIAVYDGERNVIYSCNHETSAYTTSSVKAKAGSYCYTNPIRIVIVPSY